MRFILKYRKAVLFIGIGLTIFFLIQLPQLRFKNNLNDFLNRDNDKFIKNEKFEALYKKPNQPILAIGVKEQEKLKYTDFKTIHKFTEDLNKLDWVQGINSITNLELPIYQSDEWDLKRILSLENQDSFNKDLTWLQSVQSIRNQYLNISGNSTFIFLELKDSLKEPEKAKFAILEIAEQNKLNEVFLFSESFKEHLIKSRISNETIYLVALTLLLLVLILFLVYRTIWAVLVPLIIVSITVIWTLGIMALLGSDLNLLNIAMPVIIAVISTSDVIHIISKFTLSDIKDKKERVIQVQKNMFKAIFLTSLTTTFGFLSIAFSNIDAFVVFALFCVLGVLIAFLLSFTILPILLYSFPDFKASNRLYYFLPKRPNATYIRVFLAVIVLFTFLGILKAKENNYLFQTMSSKDELSKMMNFMEEEMNGTRDYAMYISPRAESSSLLNINYLQQLSALEGYLESQLNAQLVLSLPSSFKLANASLNSGDLNKYTIPETQLAFSKVSKLLRENKDEIYLESFLSKGALHTKMSGKVKDWGGARNREVNAELLAFARLNAPDLEIHFGGQSFMIDETNRSATSGVVWSLVLVMVFIFLVILWQFKSLMVGIIFIVPNLLPLLMVASSIGWLGWGINISTMIAFTIIFGIAVDDSIHFIHTFKQALKDGMTKNEAIANTMQSAGSAILLTTITLTSGFLVLMLSSFHPNFTTGFLVSLGMVSALFCDLFLLPFLLRRWKVKT